MIKGIIIFNNHGKPRLMKFYQSVVSFSYNPKLRLMFLSRLVKMNSRVLYAVYINKLFRDQIISATTLKEVFQNGVMRQELSTVIMQHSILSLRLINKSLNLEYLTLYKYLLKPWTNALKMCVNLT